ncbi:hypothetical protein L202_04841 [Cryptococcus amylolentus CBS 6039]|uniref:Uncharacterized protein n=1 Tax=Cryptococcus amylolentus CBS 6039 TaxID=1295533 RepID=A0A1E3HPR2_9TREE|nr:hypothetical protein L202_04841 [Cryptococcus amylolentus CBS 6039]ODN77696.1 hypothetical protein L202_04841 [Cryptococcus amylolentus CBS 6039]
MSSTLAPDQIEAAAKAFVTSHNDLNLGVFIMALMNKVIAVIATVSSLAASLFFIGNSFELFVYGFGTYAKFVAVNSLS